MSPKWILLLTAALVVAAVSFGCAIAFHDRSEILAAALITPCVFLPVVWIVAVTKWAFASDTNAARAQR